MARSGRPLPNEYGAHAEADIARVAGDDAVAALAHQEQQVKAFFGKLEDSAVAGLRYAPGKWTVKEVLGHMMDDERIFTYRALCIARGDASPLASFDENAYMAGANFEARPLADLLEEYCLIRCSAIAFYRSLAPEAWLRRGTVAGYTASVRGLAFHIAGHELHHLGVLKDRYLREPVR
jgi:uncharacterized damage-inducible protein DinB